MQIKIQIFIKIFDQTFVLYDTDRQIRYKKITNNLKKRDNYYIKIASIKIIKDGLQIENLKV